MKQSQLRYHHLGIPTTVQREGEQFLPEYHVYVSGYETSEYAIEWMRYEKECGLPEVVKTLPHIAFEVDDIYAAIEGKEVIIQPNSPSEGVTVAFIIEKGAPIEFIHIEKE